MEFVSFNLTRKLKEKGFDEECLAYYTSEHILYLNKVILCDDKYLEFAEMDYEECLFSYNTQKNSLLRTVFDAPTIPQVLEWLRKKKGLHITIDIVNYGFISSTKSFRWDESYCENDIEHYNHKGYSTCEEAALAEIEYVLDNLI